MEFNLIIKIKWKNHLLCVMSEKLLLKINKIFINEGMKKMLHRMNAILLFGYLLGLYVQGLGFSMLIIMDEWMFVLLYVIMVSLIFTSLYLLK